MSLPLPGADRTCVVTGASQGIGAEIARQLVGRGHHVTLVARSADKLEELAAEITAKGGRAAVLTADLADRPARAGLLDRVDRARPDRRRPGQQRRLLHPRPGREVRPRRTR